MTAARDRADRKGTTPIQIGSTKLTTDGSDNLSVTNASGTPKKVIASEVQLGTTANDTVILSRNASTGKLKLQTTSGGGSATDSNAGGVTVYATISAMTAVSASAGDQAFVTANSGLYVHNGGGWYKVATINTSPTISSPSTGANITLATDGTATSIELVGADVDEGTTLQNSYAVTTGSLTNGGGTTATITSSATSDGTYSSLAPSTNTTNRFFKITGTTNTSHGGTFSLTFSMSDGISAGTTVQNFTLSFALLGSTLFDGTGDYLTISSSSDFTFGTGDFTVEFWAYPSNFTNRGTFYDTRPSNGTTGLTIGHEASTGEIKVFMNSTSGSDIAVQSTDFSTGSWQHIAVTRASGSVKLFIGGVLKDTGTASDDMNNTNAVNIGYKTYTSSSFSYFTGYISNFRIVKGTAVYTSAFTPSTSPLTAITNTKLLTCFNPSGTITDDSSSSHSITANGNAAANSLNPF